MVGARFRQAPATPGVQNPDMATNYMPDPDRDRAIRAARRAVADGDRPRYELRFENVAQFRDDPFGWFVWVVEIPDVYATGPTPDGAVAAARQAIGRRLRVPVESFDVAASPALRS